MHITKWGLFLCMCVCVCVEGGGLYYSTSRGCEFNTVDFTEANREDGGGHAVVAKPVWAIHRLRAIDADHEVPVRQHLEGSTMLLWREGRSCFKGRTASRDTCTFLTVAAHIVERLRGSMASNFIPSLNHSPLWSTSFTWHRNTAQKSTLADVVLGKS